MAHPKTRFAIVTPTIGRFDLKRCVHSLQSQVRKNFRQFVIGDGPQTDELKQYVSTISEAVYAETPEKTANFGCEQRNLALRMIEEEYPADYVIFVDDDNVLLEPALYNADYAASDSGNPPFLYFNICFTNKFTTKYVLFPVSMPPQEMKWDGLNGIYRSDIIRGLRWVPGYAHDFYFTQDAIAKAGTDRFVEVPGISGIHHLSWDTYAMNVS